MIAIFPTIKSEGPSAELKLFAPAGGLKYPVEGDELANNESSHFLIPLSLGDVLTFFVTAMVNRNHRPEFSSGTTPYSGKAGDSLMTALWAGQTARFTTPELPIVSRCR